MSERCCSYCGNPLPPGSHFNLRYCPGECKKIALTKNSAKWREENRDLANARTATWYQKDIDANRSKKRKAAKRSYTLDKRSRAHGMNELQFQMMWNEQGGRCWICTKGFSSFSDANIDHDHLCCEGGYSCGNCVRALLCRNCNVGLGLFGDDIRNVGRAFMYLKELGLEAIDAAECA